MLNVYLAGGFYSDWRERIESSKAASKWRCFSPTRDSAQSASYRFVRDDLAAIEEADLLLAYYPGGYSSHGMAAEIGYAAALRKPVYFIDATDTPDLFLVGLSKRLFRSVEAFLLWWEGRESTALPTL